MLRLIRHLLFSGAPVQLTFAVALFVGVVWLFGHIYLTFDVGVTGGALVASIYFIIHWWEETKEWIEWLYEAFLLGIRNRLIFSAYTIAIIRHRCSRLWHRLRETITCI
jgi:hypothetical protein